MKWWAIILLVFFPLSVFCQLSEDSLKKNCVRKYEEDLELAKDHDLQSELSTRKVPLHFKELFIKCFSNIRIFVIDYDITCCIVDAPSLARLYAFDANTGQSVKFTSDTSFFKIVNGANKKITNLDKSYLYIFLKRFEEHEQITIPLSYQERIRSNSIFLTDEAMKLFYESGEGIYARPTDPSEIYYGINNSDTWKINMYVTKFANEEPVKFKKSITYHYNFFFDRHGNLYKVILYSL